jgi:hypothetical protein
MMNSNGIPAQHNGTANCKRVSRMASRNGVGPRTRIGKERSKYNALKHGVFAKVLLLTEEPRSEFETLLRSLQHDLRPEGTLQQILVEKLAALLWRSRRLLQAENGELLRSVKEVWIEKRRRSIQMLGVKTLTEQRIARTDRRGYIADIYDSNVLESCLDKLCAVRENVERFGLDYKSHPDNLGLVYGVRYSGRPGKDLFDDYIECLRSLKATVAEKERGGFTSEEDYTRKFISKMEKEILRLEGRRKHIRRRPKWDPVTDDDEPSAEELLKCAVPDSDAMDRLLRYEASLDRAFDRVLVQLGRLQLMRESQKTIEAVHQTRTSD